MLSLFILNIMRERTDGKSGVRAGDTIGETMTQRKNPPRPRDPNQLGKLIVDIATGQVEDVPVETAQDEKMAALGRKGGLKGGKARAEAMSSAERSESARRAAKARWAKVGQR
jgi:hypothetical protein